MCLVSLHINYHSKSFQTSFYCYFVKWTSSIFIEDDAFCFEYRNEITTCITQCTTLKTHINVSKTTVGYTKNVNNMFDARIVLWCGETRHSAVRQHGSSKRTKYESNIEWKRLSMTLIACNTQNITNNNRYPNKCKIGEKKSDVTSI